MTQSPSQSRELTSGILLAGGRASRMGGGDKALHRLGGIPLLARVISIVQPQCSTLVISADNRQATFSEFGLPVVADEGEDHAGPLAGILAGLDFFAARQPSAAFAMSVPTDTPFLPADLVARLHAARAAANAEIVCARSNSASHPVIALWPLGIRAELRRALAKDVHKVDRFMSGYAIAYADWPAVPVDPFFNVNTPEDLAAAERIVAARGARHDVTS